VLTQSLPGPSAAPSRRGAAPAEAALPLPLPSSGRGNRCRAHPSRRVSRKLRAIQLPRVQAPLTFQTPPQGRRSNDSSPREGCHLRCGPEEQPGSSGTLARPSRSVGSDGPVDARQSAWMGHSFSCSAALAHHLHFPRCRDSPSFDAHSPVPEPYTVPRGTSVRIPYSAGTSTGIRVDGQAALVKVGRSASMRAKAHRNVAFGAGQQAWFWYTVQTLDVQCRYEGLCKEVSR
jgi:hypothetical protein